MKPSNMQPSLSVTRAAVLEHYRIWEQAGSKSSPKKQRKGLFNAVTLMSGCSSPFSPCLAARSVTPPDRGNRVAWTLPSQTCIVVRTPPHAPAVHATWLENFVVWTDQVPCRLGGSYSTAPASLVPPLSAPTDRNNHSSHHRCSSLTQPSAECSADWPHRISHEKYACYNFIRLSSHSKVHDFIWTTREYSMASGQLPNTHPPKKDVDRPKGKERQEEGDGGRKISRESKRNRETGKSRERYMEKVRGRQTQSEGQTDRESTESDRHWESGRKREKEGGRHMERRRKRETEIGRYSLSFWASSFLVVPWSIARQHRTRRQQLSEEQSLHPIGAAAQLLHQ